MTFKKATGLLTFVLYSFCLFGQEVKIIPLKNEKVANPLKNFYVARVKDDRADTGNIGLVRTSILNKKQEFLQLENGVSNSLSLFIHNNIMQDSAASPIILHITEFKVEEKGSSGLKTENDLSISLAFYIDAKKLYEISGGGSTQSSGDPAKLIEELVRGSVASMLQQFDQWWATNKARYIAQQTKRTIKVEVSLDDETDDSDIISYSPQRPLTLGDFEGEPDDQSTAAAITYSIIFLKYSSALTHNNEIIVDVSVLANFNKRKSWCRPENRNPEVLEHEQRHFDISAIKACELVDTIQHFQFSVDNFPAELQKIQRQKQRELDRMQDQYDAETRGAAGPAIQERWNKMVKEKLGKVDCFHS